MQNKPCLDVCCGGRLFYFEKESNIVTFQDIREGKYEFSPGRTILVKPDKIQDFRNLEYPDGGKEGFSLVVFDPPHLKRCGDKSFLGIKYGKLPAEWKEYIERGFEECFRVLKDDGILYFKWSSVQISVKEVLQLSPYRPLLGDQRGTTRRIIFIKNKVLKRIDYL